MDQEPDAIEKKIAEKIAWEQLAKSLEISYTAGKTPKLGG